MQEILYSFINRMKHTQTNNKHTDLKYIAFQSLVLSLVQSRAKMMHVLVCCQGMQNSKTSLSHKHRYRLQVV